MITLKRTTSNDAHFLQLVKSLDKDLWNRYPEEQHMYEGFNHVPNLNTVVVAYADGEPVGCGCFKPFDAESAEIKRMFVQAEQRGKGIGYLVLQELEQWASELGYRYTVLETAIRQPEAIALYQKRGYNRIPNYGPYAHLPNSICMKKPLPVTA